MFSMATPFSLILCAVQGFLLQRSGTRQGDRLLRAIGLLVLTSLAIQAQAAPTAPAVEVTAYKLLSKTPVANGVYDYSYSVEIRNQTTDALDVIATASAQRPGVELVNGKLPYGTVAAQARQVSATKLIVRAGPYLDRRLDRKVKGPLGLVWENLGPIPADEKDFERRAQDWSAARLEAWYLVKLNGLLQWSYQLQSPASAPVLSILAPAEGSIWAADAVGPLQVEYSSRTDQLNLSSLQVELDGQALTSALAPTPTGFSYSLAQALVEGPHSLRVRIADMAGNFAEQSVAFTTRTPPLISAQTPKDVFLGGGAKPVISAVYSDVGAGIDVSKTRLIVDGVDVTTKASVTATGVTYTVTQALPDAAHQVQLTVADLAGNATTDQWQFGTAQPPEILSISPKDVVLPAGSRPTIAATFQDQRVGIDTTKVRMTLNGQDVTAAAQITPSGIRYTPSADLPGGPYTVYLEVANKTNSTATAVWSFDVETAATYTVSLVDPADGLTTTTPRLTVQVAATASKTYPTDVRVNGVQLAAIDPSAAGSVTNYAGTIPLVEGPNTLTATVVYADGQTRSTAVTVTYNGPPRVTITSPVDKSTFGRIVSTSPQDLTGNVERPIKITGTISKPVTSVMINQQAAVLSDGGRAFSFDKFFLHEGMNLVTVVATDADKRTGTSAITLSVDQTAPIVSIEQPLAGSVTSNSTIDVRGLVNDAVEGFAGTPEPVVTVNGVKAQVSDRYYLAQSVPLALGLNTLTVTATDAVGNTRTQTINISRVAVGSNRLTLLSGDHQQAAANTELPKPLMVVALDEAGQPLANVPVSFDVVRGTGVLSAVQGQASKPDGINAARNLVVRTDAGGRAQVWLTIGRSSGPGANVVRAAVEQPGLALNEGVFFSATTTVGKASKVLADMGINQFAETNTQPMELMSVVVRDQDDNHLVGVPVTFSVLEGDAYFPGLDGARASSITLVTDKNGLTATRPFIGSTAGLVRIKATAQESADSTVQVGNATFTVQVKEAHDGPTSFKGFIYTDKGEPLPGVRISVARTSLSSTTDDKGAFSLEGIAPGRVDLFVDGRTTSYQGKTWPSLHFEAYAVRGQNNLLPHPVYLPPLSMGQAKTVGGDEDVILTIPGVEGFQMKVKAHSVTFPDGSKVGTLVVSPVTADRLPMAPPAGGTQFGIPAWTVQPAGTRFDPPIEVTLPNTRAYPPGETQPVVQWDHDLSQFVPMGRATVSEDGSVLITEAGSGLSKAGWGGLCVYDPDKCGQNAPPKCKFCEKVDTSGKCPSCQFDPSKDRFVSYSQNIAVSTEPFKGLLDSLTKKNIAGGEFKLKFEGAIAGKMDRICCAAKQKESSKFYASGQVKLEGEFKFNIIQVIARIKSFLPAGLDDATDAGIYALVRAGLNAAGAVGYDSCKNQADPGSITGNGYINGAVSARLKWPAIKIAGVEVFPEAEMNIGELGLTGGIKLNALKAISESEIAGAVSKFLYGYIKSDLRVGTWKLTSIDFQFPLYQQEDGHLHIPIVDF